MSSDLQLNLVMLNTLSTLLLIYVKEEKFARLVGYSIFLFVLIFTLLKISTRG